MTTNNYELATLSFIAGETQELYLRMFSSDNDRVKSENYTCDFSITRYGSLSDEPLLSKECAVNMELINGKSYDLFYLKLLPEDTIDLIGLFLYQITLKNSKGVEIYQGLINIQTNINSEFTLN